VTPFDVEKVGRDSKGDEMQVFNTDITLRIYEAIM
jgi:hypothetical protein